MPFTGDTHNLTAGALASNGGMSDAEIQHNAPLTDISASLTNLKTNSQTKSHTPSFAGAVTRTIEQRLDYYVNIFDFIPNAEIAAILAGTSTYDASTAINNALSVGNLTQRPVVGSGTVVYKSSITVPPRTGFVGFGHVIPEASKRSNFVLKKDFDAGIGAGIVFSGAYSCAHNIHFDNVAGRTGDNVKITGSRFQSCRMASTNAGRDGVLHGDAEAGAHGINSNNLHIDYLYVFNNGRHGYFCDNTNTTVDAAFPLGRTDVNTSQMVVDAYANGSDGVRIGNAINNNIRVTSQANSGAGVRLAAGAKGNIIVAYVEANSAGGIILDLGAAQNHATSIAYGSASQNITDNSGNTSNKLVGRNSNMAPSGSGTNAPYLSPWADLSSTSYQGGTYTRTEAFQFATSNYISSSVATIADGVSGTSRVWQTRESGNNYFDAMSLNGTGVLNLMRSTGRLQINGTQVVGPRGAALPADATDLTTAIALVNAIKARMIAHGLTA